jgi:hypothetical protein
VPRCGVDLRRACVARSQMQPKAVHFALSRESGLERRPSLHVVSWGFAVNLRIDVSSIMRRASQAFPQLEGGSGGIPNRGDQGHLIVAVVYDEHILTTCFDFFEVVGETLSMVGPEPGRRLGYHHGLPCGVARLLRGSGAGLRPLARNSKTQRPSHKTNNDGRMTGITRPDPYRITKRSADDIIAAPLVPVPAHAFATKGG